ncbi:unnamed protein product, partial [Nesidiocoris tenuis]
MDAGYHMQVRKGSRAVHTDSIGYEDKAHRGAEKSPSGMLQRLENRWEDKAKFTWRRKSSGDLDARISKTEKHPSSVQFDILISQTLIKQAYKAALINNSKLIHKFGNQSRAILVNHFRT